MADTTQAPINGTYAAPHAYHDSYPNNHAQVAAMNTTAASFQPAQQSSTPTNVPANNEPKHEVSKDEVGWFFVEKYYTTMSRSPEKLPLFYSRRSQFVFGTEAESVPVAVGQKAINEAIRQLDFQDCKVRVLNVDSQASFDNILVSVIGEISNKSEPSRKFVQTFVLAEQPNGYYVLNDIFRYLADEEEDEEEVSANEAAPNAAAPEAETAAAAAAPEQKEQPPAEMAPTAASNAQVDNEPAAEEVDEKLIEAGVNGEVELPKEEKEEAAPLVNGTAATADSQEVPAAATAVSQSDVPQAEKPASPRPTPAEPAQKEATAPASAPASAPAAAPEKEAAPAKAMPKTWANIASKSGAAVAVPAIPMAPPKPAVTASSTQPAAAATVPAAAPSPAVAPSTPSTSAAAPAAAVPTASTTDATTGQDAANDNAGWQTAGADHKKTQPRAGDDQNVLAYIKNVNEKVDASLLRQTLTRYGKLKYFDVSRQKNCAFVEFADPAGYAAAVAANPHQIGSEQILVEERRARGNAYGANGSFGPGRGGASGGRGRGDRPGSQGRGGFPRDGGRGGFGPRGRGGNTTPKGRSQAQAA